MRKLISFSAVLLGIASLTVPGCAQQSKANRQSPPAQAVCNLPDGKTISVDYSSPRAKGRPIFGGLVPYGQVWRLGANEATTFSAPENLNVGGKSIPAGNYTIFAIPAQDGWTLIISKKTGEWGIPYPGESNDLARIPMKAEKLPSSVENFTIAFDSSSSGCTMHADWETTRASIDISAQK
jgi:hypothetical protein